MVLLGSEVLRDYKIKVCDKECAGDLVVLDIKDFDLNLCMDWLFWHYGKVDCWYKIIHFELPQQPTIVYRRIKPVSSTLMISMIKVEKLVRHGCEAHLAFVTSSGEHKTP